jgi:uncharacterized protein YnzC (UPF0291/DUF896 family)
MSYILRFGEITQNGILENTDTRWLIAAFYQGRYIDNYGNIMFGERRNEAHPPHKAYYIPKHMETSYLESHKIQPEQTDIPLSNELIVQIKCIEIPYEPPQLGGQRDPLPHIVKHLNIIKSLAPIHYQQFLEIQSLKQRLAALEALILMPQLPKTEDLLDLHQDLRTYAVSNPFDDENAENIIVQTEDPRKLGMDLEDLIHNGIEALDPSFQCRKEQEIRDQFNDQSLNGVDHWITKNKNHILIQDKWRETTTQPEVSQYLSCVDRIQARMGPTDKVFLIWAGKYSPTKHALASLNERKVRIIHCDISIQALARNVIAYIAELFGMDPTPALKVVPIVQRQAEVTQPATFKVSAPIPEPKAPKITYDETDEGKAAKADIMTFIEKQLVQHIHRLMCNAQYQNHMSNISIVDGEFPKTVADWTTGKFSKVDFNSILKSLKTNNYPTKTSNKQMLFFEMYCKMRYISTLLAPIALEYTSKRNALTVNKSAWAKTLPTLKCKAEPMMDEEFRSAVIYTREYIDEMKVAISRDMNAIKTYKPWTLNQFAMRYYVN